MDWQIIVLILLAIGAVVSFLVMNNRKGTEYIKGHSKIDEVLKGHTRPGERLAGKIIAPEEPDAVQAEPEAVEEEVTPEEENEEEEAIEKRNPWKKKDDSWTSSSDDDFHSGPNLFKIIKGTLTFGLTAFVGWTVWNTVQPAVASANQQYNSSSLNGVNSAITNMGNIFPVVLIAGVGVIMFNIFGMFRRSNIY